ncbi:MAG: Tyrosine-protein phosphatase YwqE [Firmicutes bacterium ADurb.Bin456]|nr:MAG: Tyrosine-protein phosphatase YwqE [Firmicutes bacterium ADurb.Bin456]
MIDIHTHILPGLDDGPDSLEEALEMARRAVAGGARIMVATPHVVAGLYPNSREAVLAALGEFRRVLEENSIPLTVLPGAECRLEPDLDERLARGELLTINDGGRYLLVELPPMLVPEYTAQVCYQLRLRGVTPIIAHPERNAGLVREPGLLYDLISRGALSQITAGSLTGHLGSAAAAAAKKFLGLGYVQFIASDAHSCTGRGPLLAEAAGAAARLLGAEQGQSLVSGNPLRAIQGGWIEANPREASRRPADRGFRKRFFRR